MKKTIFLFFSWIFLISSKTSLYNYKPEPIIQPGNIGEDIYFVCQISAELKKLGVKTSQTDVLSYAWVMNKRPLLKSIDGVPVVSDYYTNRLTIHDGSTIKLSGISPSDRGLYVCSVDIVLEDEENQRMKNSIPVDLVRIFLDVRKKPSVQTRNETTYLIEENSTLILSCDWDGVPRPTVSWTFNNKPYLRPVFNDRGKKMTHLHIFNVTVDNAGQYNCIAMNQEGHASVSFNIQVQQSLAFDQVPTNKSAFESEKSISFQCTVKNPDDYTSISHQWYKNDHLLKNETEQILTLRNIQRDDHGTYKCSVIAKKNSKTYEISYNTHLSVLYKATSSMPDSMKFLRFPLNGSANLPCIVRANPKAELVQWSRRESSLGNPDNNNKDQIVLHSNTTFNTDHLIQIKLEEQKIMFIYRWQPMKKHENGFYKCRARNGLDWGPWSSEVYLSAEDSINFMEKPNREYYVDGENVDLLLNCSAQGNPLPKIFWNFIPESPENLSAILVQRTETRSNKFELPRNSHVLSNGSLSIRGITKDNINGVYLCIASNKIFTIHQEVKLIDPLLEVASDQFKIKVYRSLTKALIQWNLNHNTNCTLPKLHLKVLRSDSESFTEYLQPYQHDQHMNLSGNYWTENLIPEEFYRAQMLVDCPNNFAGTKRINKSNYVIFYLDNIMVQRNFKNSSWNYQSFLDTHTNGGIRDFQLVNSQQKFTWINDRHYKDGLYRVEFSTSDNYHYAYSLPPTRDTNFSLASTREFGASESSVICADPNFQLRIIVKGYYESEQVLSSDSLIYSLPESCVIYKQLMAIYETSLKKVLERIEKLSEIVLNSTNLRSDMIMYDENYLEKYPLKTPALFHDEKDNKGALVDSQSLPGIKEMFVIISCLLIFTLITIIGVLIKLKRSKRRKRPTFTAIPQNSSPLSNFEYRKKFDPGLRSKEINNGNEENGQILLSEPAELQLSQPYIRLLCLNENQRLIPLFTEAQLTTESFQRNQHIPLTMSPVTSIT